MIIVPLRSRGDRRRERPICRGGHRHVRTLSDCLEAGGSRPAPSRPLRLALVITDLDVGGAERALVNLASRLDRQHWAPIVIALRGEGPLATELRQANIPCECVGGRRNRPVQIILRLTRLLRKYRPEIVQSYLFHANLASRLAAPWAGRPRVVGGLRVAERQKRWHLTLDRWTAFLSSGSVCVSHGVYRFSRDEGGLSPRRLCVIPNGIDPEPFDHACPLARRDLGIPEEAHLALAVGRLDIQKGVAELLAAAENVAAGLSSWHLAFAGDGPLRDWLLEQIATRPGFSGRIHWLGPRNDVPRLLKTADVLVLASLWEGMPNVVLEAMAAGRPVVATAVEGTEDLVIPGETGWLVPPGDSPALAQALLEAARNPEICKKFGCAGRHRVERWFSLDATVAAYQRLWFSLLDCKAP